ncbi:MAG: hypothetical protein OQK75_11550, partial [Gammaproteobacteria bacterium]|nr:hypothetical protein [Gammaproteobacteria bacterium]
MEGNIMDIARTFISLRPAAQFTDNTVNFYSLETIAQTYIGTMPTQAEMDAEWLVLQSQDNDINYQKTLEADIETKFSQPLKAFAFVV